MASGSQEQDLTVMVRTTEIDLTSAQEFGAELTEAIEAATQRRARRLVLDFSEVHFMDSGGISALIDTRQRLADQGCRLELQHVQRSVLRSFDVLGLINTFAIQQP